MSRDNCVDARTLPLDAAGSEIPTFEDLQVIARQEPLLYVCLQYLRRGVITTKEEFYLLALKAYIEENKYLRESLYNKKAGMMPK